MPKWRFDRIMPFLMAVYPILFMYSINYYMIDPGDMLITLIVGVALAAVLLAVSQLVFRDVQQALFVSGTTLLLFFTYGHAFDVAQAFRHVPFFPFDHDPALLALWAVAFVASVVFALRGKRFLPGINRYAGAITALLSLVALVNIGINAALASPVAKPITETRLELHAPDVMPDIYYCCIRQIHRAKE